MDHGDQNGDQNGQAVGSILQRKTLAGREVRQSQIMSLAKALRVTLAKVADDAFEMAMAVIGVRLEVRQVDDIEEIFEGAGLLMLLDGAHRKRGAAVFDADLVGALIQQQTMGRVTPPFEGDTRPMTATDAAICAPFLDDLLSRAAPLPEDAQERAVLDGYAFGARVEDTRLLMMALEEHAYHVIHLTVDVAGGIRQGNIILCLPETSNGRGGGITAEEGDEPGAAPSKTQLDQTVLALEVELRVALTALTLPLREVQELAIGDTFDLGITAFDQAHVQTKEGRKLASGVLGQLNGARAVQLEHSNANTAQPRRRAADRAGLNLPAVRGDGTGTQGDARVGDLGQPEPAALPEIDSLDLPMVADLPGLADLEGLPDMTDLPGFEDDDMLPQMGTG